MRADGAGAPSWARVEEGAWSGPPTLEGDVG
jgi:hypothetical protein